MWIFFMLLTLTFSTVQIRPWCQIITAVSHKPRVLSGDWSYLCYSSILLASFYLLASRNFHLIAINENQTKTNCSWYYCVGSITSIVADSFATPWTIDPRLLCPWDSPGRNTGVGCQSLLQGIFLTQVSNLCLLCLLHCRWILYPLSHVGSSRCY